jgi:hypothetical protein
MLHRDANQNDLRPAFVPYARKGARSASARTVLATIHFTQVPFIEQAVLSHSREES